MQADLTTYLHDHLAGANAAVDVMSLLQEHAQDQALTQLLTSLKMEVQTDKDTLERLMVALAIHPSLIKDSAAWIGARLLTLKIKGGQSAFGSFEALEFLSLAILGKLHLWRALERSAVCQEASERPDLKLLIERAKAQHGKVEELRLVLASAAL